MTACEKLKLELTGALGLGGGGGVIPNPEGPKREIAQENEENMDGPQLCTTT